MASIQKVAYQDWILFWCKNYVLEWIIRNKFTFDQVIEDKIAAEIAGNDRGPAVNPRISV